MNSLDILEQNRKGLLLAEAVGWLHDYYKCSEELLQNQTGKGKNVNPSGGYSLNDCIVELEKIFKDIFLTFPNGHSDESLPLYTLVNASFYKSNLGKQFLDRSKYFSSGKMKNRLIYYLFRCHNTSHFDKQEPIGGKQPYPGTKISSPFGFERDVPGGLTKRLWSLPWANLKDYDDQKREELRRYLKDNFSKALGDTRRPINEVDLWSWGLLVGSLYKAALAGALLTGDTKSAKDLKWRLLSVRLNGLDYMLDAFRIPDLLARRQIVINALDRVCQLLEVAYPLGSEVYRDENGSVFVVPDIEKLLDDFGSGGKTLRDIIKEEFQQGTLRGNPKLRIGGEIQPEPEVEEKAWWGQDPYFNEKTKWTTHKMYDQPLKDELPQIDKSISTIPVLQPDFRLIKNSWKEAEIADVCTVCGLRPRMPEKTAAGRAVCGICEKRRSNRSEQWAKEQPKTTIWMDEAADANGRLALVAGRFPLDHWLDGTLLESLMVIPPGTSGEKATSKTPSFSRLRRIWETTRRFWKEVECRIMEKLRDDRRRLKISLSSQPALEHFHVYDLVINGVELDVVWVPPEEGNKKGYLVSASNLGYIARQLGAKEAVYKHPTDAAGYVKDYLQEIFMQKRCQPVLQNPEAKPGRKKQNLLESISITEVVCQKEGYAPVIPILAEPRTFMAVVPADKALEVIRDIKEKYGQEMGKVRDRLPLCLGVVYAGRRMPLRAVLEAGRAMLDRPLRPERWMVQKADRKEDTLFLRLKRNCRTITWQVPLTMGDRTTEDNWYPYIFLEGENACRIDNAGRRLVKTKEVHALEHGDKKEHLLIHMADLEKGERVYIWPSTFDFEFLDTNARRYEIYYGQDGRRQRRTRPFYLEDLDRLDRLWDDYLKQLHKSQLRQVISAIETAREDWYGKECRDSAAEDEVFCRFVADTLSGAKWPKNCNWNGIPREEQALLIYAGVHGELADLAELHLEFLKE